MVFDIPFHSVILFNLQLPRCIKEIRRGGGWLGGYLKLNTIPLLVCLAISIPPLAFLFFFKSNVFYFLKENSFFSFLSCCLQFISQNVNVPSWYCTLAPRNAIGIAKLFGVLWLLCSFYPSILADLFMNKFCMLYKAKCKLRYYHSQFYEILIVRSWCSPCHIYVLVDSRVLYVRKQLNGNKNST